MIIKAVNQDDFKPFFITEFSGQSQPAETSADNDNFHL
jgi:hypothetical protein